MPHHEDNDFSAPAEVREFAALLLDMDGTIIDSTEAIVKYWRKLGQEIGVDGDMILQTSHGRRSIDVLAIHAPHLANWDYVTKAEGTIPRDYGDNVVEIPGSRALLARLDTLAVPWAIVTSGTRALITGWLDVLALAHPDNLTTAEDVAKGKPDPACYLLGAKRLGVDGGEGNEVLVMEDAPAGVRAGKAAGFRVLAVATTHAVEVLKDAGADWIVRDSRSVSVLGWDGKKKRARVEIRDALVGSGLNGLPGRVRGSGVSV